VLVCFVVLLMFVAFVCNSLFVVLLPARRWTNASMESVFL
jgi:hypothetical protein